MDYTLQPLQITKQFILDKIPEERMMEFYLGVPVKKGLFRSPLRQDRTETCSYYRNKSGTLVMHDFSGAFHGDVFAVVMHKFNCSFGEALAIIANDFDLVKNPTIKKNKAKLEYDGAVMDEDSKTAIIQVEIRPFQQYELDWWAKYGITENTLKKYKVFSCKNVWLNGNIFHLEKDNQLVFGYYGGTKDGIELWRIYMPSRFSKRYKFISNWQSSKLQGAKLLPKDGNEFLIITKSLKDVMVLHEFGIPAIAPCSENTFITDKVLNKLKEKFKRIVVWYDTDIPGISNMRKIKKSHPELQYFFIPRKYKAKDFSDFYKKHKKEAARIFLKDYLNV